MSAGIKSNSSGDLELYSGSTKILTADSKTGVATFTNDIVATTPMVTHGANNNQLANTAYVDGKMVLGTAVATTSGTSIDFTGIPSWVKRVTIMFNGISTNGSSNYLVQVGSGSVTTSGYLSSSAYIGASNTTGAANYTNGFGLMLGSSANISHGHMVITLVSSNTYTSSHAVGLSSSTYSLVGAGSVTLSGVLDRIRITTANGTDTFDAGSINIMYEG
jgi:hypothetical protein